MTIYAVAVILLVIAFLLATMSPEDADVLQRGELDALALYVIAMLLIGIPLFGLFVFWTIMMIRAAVRGGGGKTAGYFLAIPFFR